MGTKKTLKIGSSDFKTIITDNGYFVDKTMLIKDFFENSSYTVLMPRPKRFGKTLNLSMIEHFFDINKKDSAKLFDEFEISNEKDFCKRHQNKYPVINISLKSIKATNWNDSFNHFKNEISKLYKAHKYLLQSDNLDDTDKENFKQIYLKKADDFDYQYSLQNLSEYLQTHFEEDVIILVDEYDTPIIYAYENTEKPFNYSNKTSYYSKVIEFMQTFLGEAYKGNNALQKGLLTGIMRIAKESIFSEWNNFKVFSITSPYFSDSFGFTEKETGSLLKYFNLYDKFEGVKQWYDGYKFGNTDKIYNPWSIVNYIAFNKEGFQPHWVNTSRDTLIKYRITEPYIEQELQKLIAGEIIEKDIDDDFVFADFDTNKELLWTLLTYSGYLTQIKKIKDERYELKIPNFEVRKVFKKIIIKWLDSEIKIKRDLLISTAENLINNKIVEFEKGFKQLIGDTISYFDTAPIVDRKTKKIITSKEQIFHVYTLGLLAILGDDYIIKSNREAGEGRYDIMLIPRNIIDISTSLNASNGVIIEIKQIEKQKVKEDDSEFHIRINNEIETALSQIDRNKYYKELITNEIKQEHIIKIPIVFAGKEPFVRPLPIEKKS